jgi:thiamine-monophosphate kinase
MDEFDLIARYFDWPATHAQVALAVGDDAALIDPPANARLTVASDMLVAGRHFPGDTAPEAVAHKALAVNLSDLAAMGAEPLAFTLSLGLPADTDPDWLSRFSNGLRRLAERSGCDLIGGDTVGAEILTLSVTVLGRLPAGQALTRAGARAGDRLAVSGTIGDAALGLTVAMQPEAVPPGVTAAHRDALRQRLDFPVPRLSLGRTLLGTATAGLDCSDGLLQDIGHLLDASGLAAEIDLSAMPISSAARQWLAARPEDLDRLVTGGDDYELIVALPPETDLRRFPDLTVIGGLLDGPVGDIRERHGRALPGRRGYRHFENGGD